MTRDERRQQAITMWQSIDWPDVALFLGPNADRFHLAWQKTQAKALERGAGVALGWSWPALLFGFAWFLYRKQWALGATLLVVPVALGYFFDSASGMTGVAIVMAMYAKSFVVTDAVTKVDRIRARDGSDAEIAAAGGVSIPAGVIGGAILVLAITATVLAVLTIRNI